MLVIPMPPRVLNLGQKPARQAGTQGSKETMLALSSPMEPAPTSTPIHILNKVLDFGVHLMAVSLLSRWLSNKRRPPALEILLERKRGHPMLTSCISSMLVRQLKT